MMVFFVLSFVVVVFPKGTIGLVKNLFVVRSTLQVLALNCEDSLIHDFVTFSTG